MSTETFRVRVSPAALAELELLAAETPKGTIGGEARRILESVLTESADKRAALWVEDPAHLWNNHSVFAAIVDWVRDNPKKWAAYPGVKKTVNAADRKAIYLWVTADRHWTLPKGWTEDDEIEDCDQVDNCAAGKHGAECVSYELAPFDGEED